MLRNTSGRFDSASDHLSSIATGTHLATSARRCRAPLPAWRLKRVVDYIDANVDAAIPLADLASVAGLSRMHFAAQFRLATGLSPHEFLLHRRVDQARRLLLDPEARLVDIALDVGFQTQAHFTTVFKRIVGETPHRWRRSQEASLDRGGVDHVARPTRSYPAVHRLNAAPEQYANTKHCLREAV